MPCLVGRNPYPVEDIQEWFPVATQQPRWEARRSNPSLDDMWERPIEEAEVVVFEPDLSVEERFLRLATDWSEHTRHVSSINDLTSYPSYQRIINLGWDVVPLLLVDLQQNKRFWFPALYAITKVRPFDPSDAGNGKRMTDAWVKWGKRKGII